MRQGGLSLRDKELLGRVSTDRDDRCVSGCARAAVEVEVLLVRAKCGAWVRGGEPARTSERTGSSKCWVARSPRSVVRGCCAAVIFDVVDHLAPGGWG